ncbi:hypothetical protein B566_EDAN004491 [Ephemera danica]|nr:hypothetical protein B566_EDAN004491 [Ephemera danica]
MSRQPPCFAHDVFEGFADYDVAIIMNYLIKTLKVFTYDTFNRKLNEFSFTSNENICKPVPLKENAIPLGGSALQNWTFIRYLPFIIFDEIKDVNSEVREMFLLLKKLLKCFALLRYHTMRVELFPYVSLRPKLHYFTHYPQLNTIFGPLIRLWTLRFECRHASVKQAAHISKNFINAPKTMAMSDNFKECYSGRAGTTERENPGPKEITEPPLGRRWTRNVKFELAALGLLNH